MKKMKKLTAVLLAMAIMIVFAQSVFAEDPYYYRNPNGTIQTAITLPNGQFVSGQLSFAPERDYYKINTTVGKKITFTMKNPECVTYNTGPHYEYVNTDCVNFDIALYAYVNGVFKLIETSNDGGVGDYEIIKLTAKETQYYIVVSGHRSLSDASTRANYKIVANY